MSDSSYTDSDSRTYTGESEMDPIDDEFVDIEDPGTKKITK